MVEKGNNLASTQYTSVVIPPVVKELKIFGENFEKLGGLKTCGGDDK